MLRDTFPPIDQFHTPIIDDDIVVHNPLYYLTTLNENNKKTYPVVSLKNPNNNLPSLDIPETIRLRYATEIEELKQNIADLKSGKETLTETNKQQTNRISQLETEIKNQKTTQTEETQKIIDVIENIKAQLGISYGSIDDVPSEIMKILVNMLTSIKNAGTMNANLQTQNRQLETDIQQFQTYIDNLLVTHEKKHDNN